MINTTSSNTNIFLPKKIHVQFIRSICQCKLLYDSDVFEKFTGDVNGKNVDCDSDVVDAPGDDDGDRVDGVGDKNRIIIMMILCIYTGR